MLKCQKEKKDQPMSKMINHYIKIMLTDLSLRVINKKLTDTQEEEPAT